MEVSLFWKIVYVVYPPILRVLEKVGVHKGRQDYRLGYLDKKYAQSDFQTLLISKGYSNSILAWQDTGEILNMRLVDEEIFQYHLRMFKDGEIRGHYEFTPESNPLKHVLAKFFENRSEYFEQLLGDYLVK